MNPSGVSFQNKTKCVGVCVCVKYILLKHLRKVDVVLEVGP